MKYKRTIYRPGEHPKEKILSEHEVLELFTRAMVYMSCDHLRDFYKFGYIQDATFPYEIHGYNLILTTADGEQILHEYIPVSDECEVKT